MTNDLISNKELHPLFQMALGYDELGQPIQGFEDGFNQLADVIRQTTDGADLNAMWREFQTTIRLHNQGRTALVSRLSYLVSKNVERVLYPSDEEFEEASEFGEPVGIRIGQPFNLGFDFKWHDLGARYTWMFLAEADAAQLQAIHNTALTADITLQFNKVFKAMFNNANRTTIINEQSVAVYPFYNNDGIITPPKFRGKTFASSHNHYLASGAATVTSGDIDEMVEHLWEHGYRQTLGYTLVLMVNRQEGDVIRGFSTTTGAKFTFMPTANVGGGVYLPTNATIGRPDSNLPDSIGTYGPVVIAENDWVPAGYMALLASAGERNLGNPVGIREHERAGLRGLQLVKGRDNDYPLTDSFYRHGLGTGIRHRGAGVVMKITAGAYTVPTAWA